MHSIKFVICVLFLNACISTSISAEIFSQNATITDYVRCKIHEVYSGYSYKTYYKIDDIGNTKLNNSDILLDLKLAVLAGRDAHVLLSSSRNPLPDEPVYEVVLGAGANTFCEIRRFIKKIPMKTKQIKNILSQIKPTPIHITIKKSGRVEVFVYYEILPLLSVDDPNPIDVKFLSFGSWGGGENIWFYNCPENNSISNDTNSSQIEEIMTPYTRLSEHLFSTHFDEPPSMEDSVGINFVVKNAAYNSKESVLKTRGTIFLKWFDHRIIWDPKDYDNITKMKIDFARTWEPRLILYNGKSLSSLSNLDISYRRVIHFNGTVELFSYETEFLTWCSENMLVRSWPNDNTKCQVIFGTKDNINLKLIDSIKINTNKKRDFDAREWKVVNITYKYVSFPTPEFIIMKNINIFTNFTDSLIATVELSRNREFYSKVFHTPLLVAILLTILAYSTKHPYRTGITLVGTIILSLKFLSMSSYAPVMYVPVLMKYYNIAFVFSWLSFIFVIISSWYIKHPPSIPPQPWMLQLMDNPILRFILVLDSELDYDYMNIAQRTWIEFSVILDRIMQISTGLFFIIILLRGY